MINTKRAAQGVAQLRGVQRRGLFLSNLDGFVDACVCQGQQMRLAMGKGAVLIEQHPLEIADGMSLQQQLGHQAQIIMELIGSSPSSACSISICL